ncbi:MAG: hypothetical protein ACC631_07210 [Halocynthiibacter sp.]
MFDTHKLQSIVLAGFAVLLSALTVNAVFVMISAAYPEWLPRQFFGVDFIADNRQRAQLAAAQYRDGTLADGDPFVVILGLSSASEGITLTDLADRATNRVRFLGLSGGGRNMSDVNRYAEPLLQADARPELAVFAINLFHFMDSPPATEAFLESLRKKETLDQLRGYWLINRRQDIKYAVDARIDGARSALFTMFDVRLHDETNPWREIVRMGLSQVMTEAQWRSNVQRYGERGYYDAGNYLRSTIQIGIFKDLVGEFRRRNVDTMVILMPEHSRLRALIPESAMTVLSKSLATTFGDQRRELIDLRDVVPDFGFKDISHMNSDGRRYFSPILGDAIDNRLTIIREPDRERE